MVFILTVLMLFMSLGGLLKDIIIVRLGGDFTQQFKLNQHLTDSYFFDFEKGGRFIPISSIQKVGTSFRRRTVGKISNLVLVCTNKTYRFPLFTHNEREIAVLILLLSRNGIPSTDRGIDSNDSLFEVNTPTSAVEEPADVEPEQPTGDEAEYFAIDGQRHIVINARFGFSITLPNTWRAFSRSENGDGYFKHVKIPILICMYMVSTKQYQ